MLNYRFIKICGGRTKKGAETLLQTVALYIWGAPKKVNIFIHIIYMINIIYMTLYDTYLYLYLYMYLYISIFYIYLYTRNVCIYIYIYILFINYMYI